MNGVPSAPLSSPVILAVPGVDQRPCTAWCGPAATQEIFYKGQWGYTLAQIAAMEGSGDCYNGGTCILPIRDTLNQHAPGLPWANFYVAVRLNHNSLSDAGFDLRTKEEYDIGSYAMALMVLLDANPNDGTPYCLPGYCGGQTGIIHYITVNGYAGNYNGCDWSAQTYYRDSWYNPPDQHYTDHNYFTDCIYFNDGKGSCSGNTDIVW